MKVFEINMTQINANRRQITFQYRKLTQKREENFKMRKIYATNTKNYTQLVVTTGTISLQAMCVTFCLNLRGKGKVLYSRDVFYLPKNSENFVGNLHRLKKLVPFDTNSIRSQAPFSRDFAPQN